MAIASIFDMSHPLPARRAPLAGRSFVLAVPAVLLAPWALPLQAHAQAAALDGLQVAALAPIVVTGTREPAPLDRLAADVVLIDNERVRNSSADSVEDLLRREAGVQVSRNGGPGSSASIFIRGMQSSGTVLLIDGVRIGSGTLGQAEFEALSLAQIDRIEVLRGPGSSLYGADAVGGVVQIFTKRGEGPPRISAGVAVGGDDSRSGDVSVGGKSGAFDYAASIAREQSDGVSALRPGDAFGAYNPDRDGYRRTSAHAGLGFTPAEGHRLGLTWWQSRLRSDYDASFPEPATADYRNRLDTDILAFDYAGRLAPRWTTRVQAARNEETLKSGATTMDRFATDRDQFTWQNTFALGASQQLVAAYEYLREQAESTSYTERYRRHNHALVLGWSGSFGAHSLQADLRRDENSVYDGETTGRLGWSWEFVPNWRVRALAGTTFRQPSFNDLYFPGYGVDTVRPERGRSVEFGVGWRDGASEASATVYRNRVRNLIQYQPDAAQCPADPAYAFGCADNVGRARLQGATLTAARRWGGFGLRGTVDFLDAIDRDTGSRLNRRAAHQESLDASYQRSAWNVGAALLSVGARPDGGKQLGSYRTVDLRARWAFAPRWSLEAKLLNAFDKDVEPARDYRSPGRQAWIGVRFDSQAL